MCVFSKKEKETQKINSPTGSFHPKSVNHNYLQQYQAWFYISIFFLIYSRLIRQIVGKFTCNDKKLILEFSIQRRKIWKKKKYKWNESSCCLVSFIIQRNMIYRQRICIRTVHLVWCCYCFFYCLSFILFLFFTFTISIMQIFIQNMMNTPPKIWHR